MGKEEEYIQKQSARLNHKSQIGQYPNKSGKEQVHDRKRVRFCTKT